MLSTSYRLGSQVRPSKILEGLDGVVCQMDDVLVFGRNQEEHNLRLKQVLERVKSARVTLNPTKCELNRASVKFLGHMIDHHGIWADPDKIGAICRMEAPHTVSELRRFLGMVNQLGKFSPRIAELTQPLRELLSTKRAWLWGPEQDAAFSKVKDELVQPTVLTLYNPNAAIKVSADASSFGVGAVLLQEDNEGWKPVAYASRSMSETEQRYAQIEKEALAITWACSKFSDYILGRKFLVETDHKPLIPLLNTKHLDVLPPRILRFRLRLAKFNYTVFHVPGKLLYAADALSRAPVPETGDERWRHSLTASLSSRCLQANRDWTSTSKHKTMIQYVCRSENIAPRNGQPRSSSQQRSLHTGKRRIASPSAMVFSCTTTV